MESEQAPSKNDAILELLRAGPMSAYRIARDLKLNGPGQALTRLRVLQNRGRVFEEPGPNGRLWRRVDDPGS